MLKHRFTKSYRHAVLDKTLTKQRLTSEVRCLIRAARAGVVVPSVVCLDLENGILGMELIAGQSVRERLGAEAEGEVASIAQDLSRLQLDDDLMLEAIGRQIASLHQANIIHGDLTTSNMMLRPLESSWEIVMIDFGLSYISTLVEDKAVDLYVLERAFLSTHPDSLEVSVSKRFNVVMKGYREQCGPKSWQPLWQRFEEVRMRGRKRSMVG